MNTNTLNTPLLQKYIRFVASCSAILKVYLQVLLLEWPSQSQDLNVMMNLQLDLKSDLHKLQCFLGLSSFTKKEQVNVLVSRCSKLLGTYPK